MAEDPWLTIVGIGEDGAAGLCTASRGALAAAAVVMGAARHLALVPDTGARRIVWPAPFAEGLPVLHALRGQPTVALASGDPFWFGAGSVIVRGLAPGEWRAYPGRATFALAAARLGWPLETTLCAGLHAAPFARVRRSLAPGLRAIVLVRDGAAVAALAQWLTGEGFGETRVTVMEALGGPRERIVQATAATLTGAFAHPVAVALAVEGTGRVLPCASGLADDWFDHDGQITKRPVRALALSALAPRPFERLWDIGGGSGSVAAEWCLAHPSLTAHSIEPRPDRAARIRANAARLGIDDRLTVAEGAAPAALDGLPTPQAVFAGGGLDAALLADLTARLAPGTRLVAHAVTLETEALLAGAAARHGGELMRIDLAEAAPLGSRRGWLPARPVVQWRVVL
jgi:precorrin-6Y C5,15-methyltransferase (decarboxylating)